MKPTVTNRKADDGSPLRPPPGPHRGSAMGPWTRCSDTLFGHAIRTRYSGNVVVPVPGYLCQARFRLN
jgi:hypothetical protein